MDPSRPGRVISQKYRLERRLGQGGMGEVWLARHLQLDSAVAVKLLVSEHATTAGARGRFEREAKAAAQVKSPHIVHVFDYGVDAETPYLVMELLEGEDLETRLVRRGKLSLSETLALVSPLCKALRRIHDAGLAHRDLKPSNVFLARHDDEDHVKILDFGIAKTTGTLKSGDVTTTGVVVGSPPYMSPEHVLAKKELDHRTDLWSLGVIVFRALAGRLPFSAEVVTQLLVEICIAPVPRISQLGTDLGPEGDAFFERALAREPDQRFQTATELAEAFAGLVRARSGRGESESPREAIAAAAKIEVATDAMADMAAESTIEVDAAVREALRGSTTTDAKVAVAVRARDAATARVAGDAKVAVATAVKSATLESTVEVRRPAGEDSSGDVAIPVRAEAALESKGGSRDNGVATSPSESDSGSGDNGAATTPSDSKDDSRDKGVAAAPPESKGPSGHDGVATAPLDSKGPSGHDGAATGAVEVGGAEASVEVPVAQSLQKAGKRRGDSLVPAVAIGVVAAALLMWAASALSSSGESGAAAASGAAMTGTAAGTGPAARPVVASGPEVTNAAGGTGSVPGAASGMAPSSEVSAGLKAGSAATAGSALSGTSPATAGSALSGTSPATAGSASSGGSAVTAGSAVAGSPGAGSSTVPGGGSSLPAGTSESAAKKRTDPVPAAPTHDPGAQPVEPKPTATASGGDAPKTRELW